MGIIVGGGRSQMRGIGSNLMVIHGNGFFSTELSSAIYLLTTWAWLPQDKPS